MRKEECMHSSKVFEINGHQAARSRAEILASFPVFCGTNAYLVPGHQ